MRELVTERGAEAVLAPVLLRQDRCDGHVGLAAAPEVRDAFDIDAFAGKVGVKLVFPIFFFILPSMLVVAAGPGLLQVFKYLFPMMKQFNG